MLHVPGFRHRQDMKEGRWLERAAVSTGRLEACTLESQRCAARCRHSPQARAHILKRFRRKGGGLAVRQVRRRGGLGASLEWEQRSAPTRYCRNTKRHAAYSTLYYLRIDRCVSAHAVYSLPRLSTPRTRQRRKADVPSTQQSAETTGVHGSITPAMPR